MPTTNNEVNGSLQDKSQALDGPQVKKALIATKQAVSAFFFCAFLRFPSRAGCQEQAVL